MWYSKNCYPETKRELNKRKKKIEFFVKLLRFTSFTTAIEAYVRCMKMNRR